MMATSCYIFLIVQVKSVFLLDYLNKVLNNGAKAFWNRWG